MEEARTAGEETGDRRGSGSTKEARRGDRERERKWVDGGGAGCSRRRLKHVTASSSRRRFKLIAASSSRRRFKLIAAQALSRSIIVFIIVIIAEFVARILEVEFVVSYQIAEVLNFFGLNAVMCMGVAAGAYILTLFA
ncbi:hypothetical protein HN51_058430, partial [Arachis hypogaea]